MFVQTKSSKLVLMILIEYISRQSIQLLDNIRLQIKPLNIFHQILKSSKNCMTSSKPSKAADTRARGFWMATFYMAAFIMAQFLFAFLTTVTPTICHT